jgi:hypothetical protein
MWNQKLNIHLSLFVHKSNNMKKILFIIWIILQSFMVSAQVAQDWVKTYDGTGGSTDQAYAMARDSEGNVYVTGSSLSAGPGTEDYVTIKYSLTGIPVWTARYDGKGFGQDIGTAIAVGAGGYVYVTGTSWIGGSDFDYVTIKYNLSGDTLWTRRYNGPRGGNDRAQAISVDGNGNVYVTGFSEGLTGTHGIFEDYATVCYTPGGAVNWIARYNGLAGDYDEAVSIGLDNLGFVYVTGTSDDGSSGSGDPHFDFATIKYDTVDGTSEWVNRYNGTGNGDDEAIMLKVDPFGNVIVTGQSYGPTSYTDFLTIKYNPAGDSLWSRRLTSPGDNGDEPKGLAVDDSGNVVVTGKYYGGAPNSWDFATVKYNRAGDLKWMKEYNGTSSGDDEGISVATDSLRNIFVTGSVAGTGAGYATLKYDAAGTEKWEIGYTDGGDAIPVSVIADNAENVWVAGYGFFSSMDYLTVKYKKEPVGISETSARKGEFVIFPNPCSENTEIRVTVPSADQVTIFLTDLSGKKLCEMTQTVAGNTLQNIVLNTSGLKDGIYFCTVTGSGFSSTQKLLIRR